MKRISKVKKSVNEIANEMTQKIKSGELIEKIENVRPDLLDLTAKKEESDAGANAQLSVGENVTIKIKKGDGNV